MIRYLQHRAWTIVTEARKPGHRELPSLLSIRQKDSARLGRPRKASRRRPILSWTRSPRGPKVVVGKRYREPGEARRKTGSPAGFGAAGREAESGAVHGFAFATEFQGTLGFS